MSAPPAPQAKTAYKSKTIATWLALCVGVFGLHRFYLHGLRDKLGWLFPWPTLVGLYGFQRVNALGPDDKLASLLMPALGVMLAIAMLSGIIYGLTPDERWARQRNGGVAGRPSGWAVIIAVVFCLLVGGISLMSTIAFSAQRYFEIQAGG